MIFSRVMLYSLPEGIKMRVNWKCAKLLLCETIDPIATSNRPQSPESLLNLFSLALYIWYFVWLSGDNHHHQPHLDMYIYIYVFRGFYIRLFVRTPKTSLRCHWSDAYKIGGNYPKWLDLFNSDQLVKYSNLPSGYLT